MRYYLACLTGCILLLTSAIAQTGNGLLSGPWAGNVELRNATIWAEVSPEVKSVAVKFYPEKESRKSKIVVYKGELGNEFNPVKIELNGLEFNTVYAYTLIINGKPAATTFKTSFVTKDLWQYRKPAPDFSLLAGSCAYFNEPVYDRPGKPYGGDSSIFETMAKTEAAFHIWMGDSWYTREVDYSTTWGLNYRVSRDRGQKILQPFMASMPQYAIWDDHDYGPNDAGKSYHLKEESRNIFKNYTLNPSYGEAGQGIYTKLSYSDVDFFLTDDRYFRSEEKLLDSVDGNPATNKSFFGPMQLEWLKNSLLYSKATFKVIVVGSQVMNPLCKYESMRHYTREYNDFMQFLLNQKIPGVVFLTGDRHHSEVIRVERTGYYPLYDITVSPYTAGISKVKDEELNNPYRVANTLVEAQNFARIRVSGKKNERILQVQYLGLKGEKVGEWQVSETELK